MPNPKKGESKQDYIARAIPAIIKDTGKDQKQAAGQAYGMWDAARQQEKFLTMRKFRSAYGDTVLSIYKNPSQREMRTAVAFGARGYLTSNGDLYLEGYEDSPNVSRAMHDIILSILKDIDPTIIPESIEDAWSCIAYGVTVQRAGSSNDIYIGESVYEEELEAQAQLVQEILDAGAEKNPLISFHNARITEAASNEAMPSHSGLRGRYYLLEGIDLNNTYDIQVGDDDDAELFRDFRFSLEDGTRYMINTRIDDIYPAGDISEEDKKVVLISFGIIREDNSLSFERREVSTKEMFRIIATVMKAAVQTVKESGASAIVFHANKNEPDSSRRRAYRTIAEQAAKYLGWKYFISEESKAFESYYVFSSDLTEDDIIGLIVQTDDIGEGDIEDRIAQAFELYDKYITIKFPKAQLAESFFTMGKVLTNPSSRESRSFTISIYKNPSMREFKNLVALGSRGFISAAGDLYLEGYENTAVEDEPNMSQVMHGPILQLIQKKDPSLISDVEANWNGDSFEEGLSVQRAGNSNDIYIGETIYSEYIQQHFEEIKQTLLKAQDKNTELRFHLASITDIASEDSLQNYETEILASELKESISNNYWKNGGPTRNQNDITSFDDIKSGKAGAELLKGFDLSKREVHYLGPVLGDELVTRIAEKGMGRFMEDSKRFFESKDYAALLQKMKAEKDPDELSDFFNSLEEDVGMSANFQLHAPEHMLPGSPITLRTGKAGEVGLRKAKRGAVEDDSWDGAYNKTVSRSFLREEVFQVTKNQLPQQAASMKPRLLSKNVVMIVTDPDTKGNPIDVQPGPPAGFIAYGRGGVLKGQLWIDGGVNGSPNGHRSGTTMGFYWGVTREPQRGGQRVLVLRGRSGATPEQYESFFKSNLDIILKDTVSKIPPAR